MAIVSELGSQPEAHIVAVFPVPYLAHCHVHEEITAYGLVDDIAVCGLVVGVVRMLDYPSRFLRFCSLKEFL